MLECPADARFGSAQEPLFGGLSTIAKARHWPRKLIVDANDRRPVVLAETVEFRVELQAPDLGEVVAARIEEHVVEQRARRVDRRFDDTRLPA